MIPAHTLLADMFSGSVRLLLIPMLGSCALLILLHRWGARRALPGRSYLIDTWPAWLSLALTLWITWAWLGGEGPEIHRHGEALLANIALLIWGGATSRSGPSGDRT